MTVGKQFSTSLGLNLRHLSLRTPLKNSPVAFKPTRVESNICSCSDGCQCAALFWCERHHGEYVSALCGLENKFLQHVSTQWTEAKPTSICPHIVRKELAVGSKNSGAQK
jgi:hypothetical protein